MARPGGPLAAPPLTPPAAPAVRLAEASAAPSLRTNIAWTVGGNAAYLASQWGLLLVLAKYTSPAEVGLFGLALAVTGPVFAFALLQLRAVLAADASGRYAARTYLSLRLAMTLAGAAVAVVIGATVYDGRATAVIAVVAAMKAVECVSEICYGFFQHDERMDLVARSMLLKGAATLAAGFAAAALTGSLLAVAGAALAVWVVTAAAYDLPHLAARTPLGGFFRADRAESRTLLAASLPLGLVTALLSLAVSAPRYVVETTAGVAVLGFYTAVSYIPNAVGSVVSSVGQASSARLARLAMGRSGFESLLWRLTGAAIAAGILGTLGALVLGSWTLGVLYTPAYSGYAPLLAGLFVAFVPNYVSATLVCGLFAVDELRVQLPVVAAMAVVGIVVSYTAVPALGLWGAVLALGSANGVQCLGYAWALRRGVARRHAAAVL